MRARSPQPLQAPPLHFRPTPGLLPQALPRARGYCAQLSHTGLKAGIMCMSHDGGEEQGPESPSALSLTDCVTLDGSLHLSRPPFPIYRMGMLREVVSKPPSI